MLSDRWLGTTMADGRVGRGSPNSKNENDGQACSSRDADGLQRPDRVNRKEPDDQVGGGVDYPGGDEASGGTVALDVLGEVHMSITHAANEEKLEQIGNTPGSHENDHALGSFPHRTMGEDSQIEAQDREFRSDDETGEQDLRWEEYLKVMM